MKTTTRKVPSSEQRAASAEKPRSPLAPRSSLLAPRRRPRRGISLLEVLIAMFVMLFGLMGVAAIMPVGNHYAARSDQYDRGAALASSAFAELKNRGLLQPGAWMYPNNTYVMDQSTGDFTPNPGHAYVLDPVGAAEASGGPNPASANHFPYDAQGGSMPGGWTLAPASTQWPLRRVSLPGLSGTSVAPAELAEAVFRLRDDLSGELPTQGDRPGIQRWQTNSNGTEEPYDDTLLARAYAGSYSWLATVLPLSGDALLGLQPNNARHGSFLYEVSVAVFRKRDDAPSTASERLLQAELGPGGDLVVFGADDITVDDASQDIRAGNWIAIAGVQPSSGSTGGRFLLKWYRVLSYDDETDEHQLYPGAPTRIGRRAMVDGPEWPETPGSAPNALNLRAILLPNVIGVSTQTVKLETN